jgi:molybdopterin biosynthesis enzyme MoaB
MKDLNLRPITKIIFKDLGIETIRIEFSGGGDDGSIDCISYFNSSDEDLEDKIPQEQKEDVERAFYEVIDNLPYDWVNNEGGNGIFTLDLTDNTTNLDLDMRYINYESYNFNSEIKIQE